MYLVFVALGIKKRKKRKKDMCSFYKIVGPSRCGPIRNMAN